MAAVANIKIILKKSKIVLFFESLNKALESMRRGDESFFIEKRGAHYLISGNKVVNPSAPALKVSINGDDDKKIDILEDILGEKIEIKPIMYYEKTYFGPFDGTSEALEEEEENILEDILEPKEEA